MACFIFVLGAYSGKLLRSKLQNHNSNFDLSIANSQIQNSLAEEFCREYGGVKSNEIVQDKIVIHCNR